MTEVIGGNGRRLSIDNFSQPPAGLRDAIGSCWGTTLRRRLRIRMAGATTNAPYLRSVERPFRLVPHTFPVNARLHKWWGGRPRPRAAPWPAGRARHGLD